MTQPDQYGILGIQGGIMPKTTIYIHAETAKLEAELKQIIYKIDRITGASYQDYVSNPSQIYRFGIAAMRVNYLDALDSLLNDPAYADIVKALGYKND